MSEQSWTDVREDVRQMTPGQRHFSVLLEGAAAEMLNGRPPLSPEFVARYEVTEQERQRLLEMLAIGAQVVCASLAGRSAGERALERVLNVGRVL